MSDPNRATRELEIINRLGLHARAAARFVEVASAHQAEVMVRHANGEANGKSIMGLMMLAAACGSRLTISACGSDAQAAIDALTQLIGERFGEPD